MKRRELIRQLEAAGCVLKRRGSRHDIYFNPAANRCAPVPRHTEVPDSLCGLILRQLGLRSEAPGRLAGSDGGARIHRIGYARRLPQRTLSDAGSTPAASTTRNHTASHSLRFQQQPQTPISAPVATKEIELQA
ncbi:MAG: type II toxin-antitoxin system HicA family toxin [Bryobacteraceae bacterium]